LTNQIEYRNDILFQGLRCLVDIIEQEMRWWYDGMIRYLQN
jgi:hypothetical protein